MTTIEAVMIIEGASGDDYTTDQYREAWQYLYDIGIVWELQGWYGRTAKGLLESGFITAKE